MKRFLLSAALLCGIVPAFAGPGNDTTTISDTAAIDLVKQLAMYDSIEATLKYETGVIDIQNGLAKLTVPKGYKYLNPEQSNYVLTEIWGNPPSTTLGLLFPDSTSPINFTYAIELSYTEDGHVDDDDAEDINYDDMLVEMKKDVEAANIERQKEGYATVSLIGWASPPFYDAEGKKLHWAKEVRFSDSQENTLNYNIVVLGRKGMLTMNVISDMRNLPAIKKDMDKFLSCVSYSEGNTYSDFDPDIDKVAAYGIGALVAGKVLGKVGFLALIAKFGKVIVLAVGGAIAAFRKKLAGLFNRKKKAESTDTPAPPAV